MIEEHDIVISEQPIEDADVNGHLATAIFIGVILLMLVCIYALATAT